MIYTGKDTRKPLPRGSHFTVRCAGCGEFGRNEKPACDHEPKWMFITAGMTEWVAYADRFVGPVL